MSDIPLMIPSVTDREVEAVAETVKSGWLSHHGEEVDKFEEEFADYVGSDHAVTTSSGTDAIRLALEAVGVEPGDEVIVPTMSYIATVTPVIHAGAKPVFVDIERHDFSMDPDGVRARANDKTKAIILAHLYGMGGQAKAIQSVADEYDAYLIEDAAEALGARTLQGEMCGTVGDIGIYSFTGSKVLNTGQGGMAVTDDEDLADRMDHLKHHATMARHEKGYRHDEAGFNFCLTNFQAALGRVQLDRYDEMLAARREIGAQYHDHLDMGIEGVSYIKPSADDDSDIWWHPVALFQSRAHRVQAEKALDAEGIAWRRTFYPLPWQEAVYEKRGDVRAAKAQELYETTLMLPCWPEMTAEQVNEVCSALDGA